MEASTKILKQGATLLNVDSIINSPYKYIISITETCVSVHTRACCILLRRKRKAIHKICLNIS